MIIIAPSHLQLAKTERAKLKAGYSYATVKVNDTSRVAKVGAQHDSVG